MARLLWSPNPGYHGADALEILPAESLDQKRQRLSAAEALLSHVEDRARSRSKSQGHASNVVINLLGAGVIMGVGGVERAWDDSLVSFGLGVVAGEVMSFTMPSRGAKDAAAYRRNFAKGPYTPPISWRVVPTTNGLSVQFVF